MRSRNTISKTYRLILQAEILTAKNPFGYMSLTPDFVQNLALEPLNIANALIPAESLIDIPFNQTSQLTFQVYCNSDFLHSPIVEKLIQQECKLAVWIDQVPNEKTLKWIKSVPYHNLKIVYLPQGLHDLAKMQKILSSLAPYQVYLHLHEKVSPFDRFYTPLQLFKLLQQWDFLQPLLIEQSLDNVSPDLGDFFLRPQEYQLQRFFKEEGQANYFHYAIVKACVRILGTSVSMFFYHLVRFIENPNRVNFQHGIATVKYEVASLNLWKIKVLSIRLFYFLRHISLSLCTYMRSFFIRFGYFLWNVFFVPFWLFFVKLKYLFWNTACLPFRKIYWFLEFQYKKRIGRNNV